MRLRIRGPDGQSSLVLPEEATVNDLRKSIVEKTSVHSFDLKYGYPPKPLDLRDFEGSSKLIELPIKLNGEQLLVSAKQANTDVQTPQPQPKAQHQQETPKPEPTPDSAGLRHTVTDTTTPFSFSGVGQSPPPSMLKPSPKEAGRPPPPLSLQRKPNPTADDPPEVSLPSRAAKLVLRIMPDDNSCLFRAFGSAFFGIMDNMTELRSVIASHIQSNKSSPDYSEVVLEKPPDDYCRWIQTEDAWGGAIELNVLSRHFGIEICSIDVQTGRIDRFNEGMEKRCILVYSGIHYDTIALCQEDTYSADGFAAPEDDVKIFDAKDNAVLAAALELCRELKKRHYYTDTAGFQVRCNVCGKVFTGEKGATEHASKTGHYDYGEAG
ncbi:MAG: hypothetical protein L6R39_004603 [Caloplaca ligustica]|nr:MAG: hypothetical protein L6R39_004603 [Caloplaca ligustica]